MEKLTNSVPTKIARRDLERLKLRAAKHGVDCVKEIAALLDLAEALEAKGGDAALEIYRAQFIRAPKRDN